MTKKCEICAIREYVLFETHCWRAVLSYDQDYLGRCMVVSNRHAGSLSQITEEEWADLHRVIEKLETSLKKAFPFTLFNWTCLMNHAYKEKPYNPHVHWHVKPRHDQPIMFDGRTWTDTEFGKHYLPKSSNVLPEEILQKMVLHIQKQL